MLAREKSNQQSTYKSQGQAWQDVSIIEVGGWSLVTFFFFFLRNIDLDYLSVFKLNWIPCFLLLLLSGLCNLD